MRKRRKYHAGHIRKAFFHCVCDSKSIIICIAGHTDNEVNIGGIQYFFCFFNGTYLLKSGWITQSQLHILAIYFLVNAPIIFEHKGVVRIGYNQYIVDATLHQIDKSNIF